jgi:hypothetical protein
MKEDFCDIKKIIAMEKITLILKFVFLILCISAVSCGDTLEMAASRKNGFINTVRKDGVEFRLSLLNEQGKPAVTFREGENISLRFEMENLRKNDGREYSIGLFCEMRTGGFGEVFTSDNMMVCALDWDVACLASMQTFSFDGENRYVYTSRPLQSQRPPVVLPKGDYYTGFTHTFKYRIPDPPNTRVEIGPITMNIDFTVE